MSYLRLVPSSSSPPVTSDEACLGAFQQELNYVFRTLRRLGTAPYQNSLVHARVIGYKAHPVLLADWMYVDIDTTRQ